MSRLNCLVRDPISFVGFRDARRQPLFVSMSSPCLIALRVGRTCAHLWTFGMVGSLGWSEFCPCLTFARVGRLASLGCSKNAAQGAPWAVFREEPNVRKRPSGAGVKPGQACDEGKRPTLPTYNPSNLHCPKLPMPSNFHHPQTSNALRLQTPSNFQCFQTSDSSNFQFLQCLIPQTP